MRIACEVNNCKRNDAETQRQTGKEIGVQERARTATKNMLSTFQEAM